MFIYVSSIIKKIYSISHKTYHFYEPICEKLYYNLHKYYIFKDILKIRVSYTKPLIFWNYTKNLYQESECFFIYLFTIYPFILIVNRKGFKIYIKFYLTIHNKMIL